MNIRIVLSALLALALPLWACSDQGIDGDVSNNTGTEDTTADAQDNVAIPADPASASERIDQVAVGVCSLAMRCCDDDSLSTYFGFWTSNPNLTELVDGLPPTDLESCRQDVATLMTEIPLGDWFAAVEEGTVSLNESAFTACLEDLENASCGPEAREALFDAECFGQAPPLGGEVRRSFVDRTQTEGTCTPINDGIGSSFFGTCDPALAFCCYGVEECGFPYGDDQSPQEGICQPTSSLGEACSPTPPIQVCQSGLSCDANSGTCIAVSTDQLTLGEECVDDAWNLLGECADSFCDLLGTGLCEALKANGQACFSSDECASGACDGTCTPNELCSGS